MASRKSVWGIDIGQCALKAMKLREIDGQLEVVAFDVIEHPHVLSKDDTDSIELIRDSLQQFLHRNNTSGVPIVVGVPGKSSFTRFIKLPPVDPKRIPEIVRFEAEQQIPFPIDDVVWRWQTFQDPDNPDVELGIFAMKKTDVDNALSYFNEVELKAQCVQMAPLALYNFMTFDDQLAQDGATLLVDIGVDKTDLVVADGARIWTRTINIGGSDFTEALVRAFKLPFNKAEKLKRSAATSKYARQIFQAMRPVFADLVQEIQRSIGYYTSLHRKTRLKRLVGMGNGFRLPGLQKYLEQNLSTPVVKIDTFNNLAVSENVSVPEFTENILSFAVSYGLAVQGMGLAEVKTNLLPDTVTVKRLWAKKKPYWVVSAAMLLITAFCYGQFWKSNLEIIKTQGAKGDLVRSMRIVSEVKTRRNEYDTEKRKIATSPHRQQTRGSLKLFGFSNFIPLMQAMISQATSVTGELKEELSDQYIYRNALAAQEAGDRILADQLRDQLMDIPRNERKLIFMQSLQMKMYPDLAKFDQEGLGDYVDELLGRGKAAADIVREKPAIIPRTGTLRTRKTKKPDLERGFVVTFIGRTPATVQLGEQILAAVRRRSYDIANGEGMGSLSLKGFQVGFDEPEAKVLRGKVQEVVQELSMGKDASTVGIAPRSGGIRRGGTLMPGMGGIPSGHVPRRPVGADGKPIEDALIEADPMFPNEEANDDRFFVAVWVFKIENDGVDIPGEDSSDKSKTTSGNGR